MLDAAVTARGCNARYRPPSAMHTVSILHSRPHHVHGLPALARHSDKAVSTTLASSIAAPSPVGGALRHLQLSAAPRAAAPMSGAAQRMVQAPAVRRDSRGVESDGDEDDSSTKVSEHKTI